MHLFEAIFGQSKNNPASSQGRFSRIILYSCIAFFVIAVVFVSFTYNGKWQAGLIEVGGSIFLFVIFLHILKIIIPQSSGIIITTLSILIAVILVCANLSLQRNKNKEYTFNELPRNKRYRFVSHHWVSYCLFTQTSDSSFPTATAF